MQYIAEQAKQRLCNSLSGWRYYNQDRKDVFQKYGTHLQCSDKYIEESVSKYRRYENICKYLKKIIKVHILVYTSFIVLFPQSTNVSTIVQPK